MAYLHVKIHYGPYKTEHSFCHKTDKIEGLKGKLLKLGYRVTLVPVEHINYCLLEMCAHQIFRCDVNDFQFKNAEEDPLCQQAVRAVQDASAKFLRADTYYWLWSLIEDQMFLRNKYTPKPTWPVHIEFRKKFGLFVPKCPCGCVRL